MKKYTPITLLSLLLTLSIPATVHASSAFDTPVQSQQPVLRPVHQPASEAITDTTAPIFGFIYTSDQHYGIKRTFRGEDDVDASVVNKEMIKAINALPGHILPDDNGVGQGLPASVDFIIQTGDITSRSDKPGIPRSATQIKQFEEDYINGITITDASGERIPFYLTAGNHDLSNAIGHRKIPTDSIDNSAMVWIYNYMFPDNPVTSDNFNPDKDLVSYVRDINGIRFAFIQMWPDSAHRALMANAFDTDKPVFIFTHDQPDIESKHLLAPTDIADNADDCHERFEKLVSDRSEYDCVDSIAHKQHGELKEFLSGHSNIKAYFHGNYNYNEFYEFSDDKRNLSVPVIRVDSPMKGKYSSDNESLLSFQLVTVDAAAGRMTVREILWNTPQHEDKQIVFGDSKTFRFY